MTDPEQDDVFEAYLKRRAVLPALDNKLEPPAALDAAVLAEARAAIQPEGGSRISAVARDAVDRGAASADMVDAAANAPSASAEVETSGTGPRRGAAVADTSASRGGGGPPGGLIKLPTGRPPRWAVPMALAATVLLCLSVIMNISLNTNRPRSSPNLERMAAARADSKVSALSNATAESNTAAGVDAPGSGAAHDQLADDGQRPQSVSGEIPSREVVLPRAKVAGVAAPRAPVVVESAAAPNASSADLASSPAASTASVAPSAQGPEAGQGPATPTVAAPPAPPVNVAGNLTATPSAAAADEPRMAAADKAVMMAKRAGIASQEYTPAPEASRAAGQAGANQQAGARAAVAARQAAPGGAVANQPAAPGGAVADQQSVLGARQAAATAPVAAHATEKSAVALAGHPSDPKVWLQQINALRAAGKKVQADAELRRFKQAFPDYAIPAPAPAPTAAGSDLPK